MKRWLSRTGRATMLLVGALCTGTTMRLAAQQPTGGAPSAAQTSSAPTPVLSGPRLKAEWPRFDPGATNENASNSALLAAAGGSHTIVFSTLALVIIGVIVLVLVL
jgi:hypothetical protein